MIRRTRIVASALALALGLSGCSSKGEGNANLLSLSGLQAIAQIRDMTSSAPQGRKPVVQITTQQLEKTREPALQVNPELRGGSDFLRLFAQGSDDTPGTISVWRSSDNALLFVRGGVLVGTRGLGGDIISSDAGPIIAAVAGARAGQGERRYFVTSGASQDAEVVLSCDIDNLGRVDTRVVNQSYQTVHLRETCVGGAADRTRIVNEYWVQPGSGTVRRSRQWAGPLAGYYEMILLKN